MHFYISHEDGTPIYLQVIKQVKYLVASGALKTGDELPPIRTLAEQLVVNPNTVARAYKELQAEGIIDKRGTAGSFIANNGSPLARREQLKRIEQRIDTLLSDAINMDISLEALLGLIHARSKKIAKRSGERNSRNAG